MMRHSARPIETNIVIEESLNEDDDEFYPTPTIRRHRPVTALVRRRSSKLEKTCPISGQGRRLRHGQ